MTAPAGAAVRGGGALVPTRITRDQHRRSRVQVTCTYTRPRDVIPGHVSHCVHQKAPGPRWYVYTWKKAEAPSGALRVPYQCRSWRCEVCAEHESRVLYARIAEARSKLDAHGWTFWVLTLDNARGRWRSAAHAYAELARLTRRFLDRLRYRIVWRGKRKFREPRYSLRNQWVATVEAHKSGMPHVNLMIWCPDLAADVDEQVRKREAMGMLGRNRVLLSGDLLSMVTASGWGVQATAERARSPRQVASYMVKVAAKADATASEVAKCTQLPKNAPARFRRLRSGEKFLPKRYKNPDYTGTLVRRTKDQNGAPCVLPLHKVPERDRETVVRCCYSEEDRWIREQISGDPGALVVRVVFSRGPP